MENLDQSALVRLGMRNGKGLTKGQREHPYCWDRASRRQTKFAATSILLLISCSPTVAFRVFAIGRSASSYRGGSAVR